MASTSTPTKSKDYWNIGYKTSQHFRHFTYYHNKIRHIRRPHTRFSFCYEAKYFLKTRMYVDGEVGQEDYALGGSHYRSNIPDSIFLVYNKKRIVKHRHIGS